MNSQKTAIYAINKIHIEQKKVSFLFRKIKSREREILNSLKTYDNKTHIYMRMN